MHSAQSVLEVHDCSSLLQCGCAGTPIPENDLYLLPIDSHASAAVGRDSVLPSTSPVSDFASPSSSLASLPFFQSAVKPSDTMSSLPLSLGTKRPAADVDTEDYRVRSSTNMPSSLQSFKRARLGETTPSSSSSEVPLLSVSPEQDSLRTSNAEKPSTAVPPDLPMPNTQDGQIERVLWPLAQCPERVEGEICVGGRGLALGYLDEATTAQAFVTLSVLGSRR